MSEYKERARELFLQGFNCSQAVFCAFADDYDIPRELALKLSASFGGGIGRMRETCGALCGACMLAGLEKGQTKAGDNKAKQENYKLVQDFAGKFKARNGSIRCGDLLKNAAANANNPVPEERTAEYYKERPCLRMVDTAVEIFEDYLNIFKNKSLLLHSEK